MKNKSIFGFFAGAVITAAVFTLSAFRQTGEAPSYATMNVIEYTAMQDSKIVIIYENGVTEEIPLEHVSSSKKSAANAAKIHETLNMLTHKGYRLAHTSGGLFRNAFILEK